MDWGRDGFVEALAPATELVPSHDRLASAIADAWHDGDPAPVIELGLVGTTMHMVDERTPTAEIERLTTAYGEIITRYFETF